MGESVAGTMEARLDRARQPWQVPLATMSKLLVMVEPSLRVILMLEVQTGSVLPLVGGLEGL